MVETSKLYFLTFAYWDNLKVLVKYRGKGVV